MEHTETGMAADEVQLKDIKSLWALTQLATDERFSESVVLQMAKLVPGGEVQRPLLISLFLRRLEQACRTGVIVAQTLRSLQTVAPLMAKELREEESESTSPTLLLEVATHAAISELQKGRSKSKDVESILKNTLGSIDASEEVELRVKALRRAAEENSLDKEHERYLHGRCLVMLQAYVDEARRRLGPTSLEAVLEFVADMNEVVAPQLAQLSRPSLQTLLRNTLNATREPPPAAAPAPAATELSAEQVAAIANSPNVLQAIRRASLEVARARPVDVAADPGVEVDVPVPAPALFSPARQEERDAAGALCGMGGPRSSPLRDLQEKVGVLSTVVERSAREGETTTQSIMADAELAANRVREERAAGTIRSWQDEPQNGVVSSPAVAGVQLSGLPSTEAQPGALQSAELQTAEQKGKNKKHRTSRPGPKRVGKRKWTELQDLTLLADIVELGKNWADIADKYEKEGILFGRNNVDMKDRWRNLLRKEGGLVSYYAGVHRRQELAEPGSEEVSKLLSMVEVDKAKDLSSQPPETPGSA